jgi:hypothetical protein
MKAKYPATQARHAMIKKSTKAAVLDIARALSQGVLVVGFVVFKSSLDFVVFKSSRT